ncbi:MAG: DUF2948 family protein [Pseudomonadota bacterium]
MTDARFEDLDYAGDPVRLAVETPEDVPIAASLLQDAVAVTGEISWMPKRRRLALLLNRFRWEDRDAAEADGRPFERVRAALVIDSAQAVQARGVDPKDKDQIISVLSMSFEPASDQEGDVSGTVILTLAGDGEIAARVECLDIRIMDMSQPWAAPSGRAPDHALGTDDS